MDFSLSKCSTPIIVFVVLCTANCLPCIPEKGTVGASGDLAPLSHMALGLMGEGKMWSPETGWDDAKKVLGIHKLRPIKLGPKEVSDIVSFYLKVVLVYHGGSICTRV